MNYLLNEIRPIVKHLFDGEMTRSEYSEILTRVYSFKFFSDLYQYQILYDWVLQQIRLQVAELDSSPLCYTQFMNSCQIIDFIFSPIYLTIGQLSITEAAIQIWNQSNTPYNHSETNIDFNDIDSVLNSIKQLKIL